MASLNSSLNNLRGRSSDGRGSMPNLLSSGATSRGASGHADPYDETRRKQQEELDDIARRLRQLNQNSPPSQTQIRGRPSSRERVSFAGTPSRSRPTSPSSEDDGGIDDDGDISRKDRDTVKIILSFHRDMVLDLGYRLVFNNSLLIVTGYDEAFRKIHLTIRNLFNGRFLSPVQMGKIADAVLKMYIEGLAHVFDTVAGDDDKNNAESLVRFVIIGIAFGPDRALVAYKDLDHLWSSFRRTHDDDKFEDLIQDKDFLDLLGGLEDLRDIFYSYFREDGYDPRVLSPIKKRPSVRPIDTYLGIRENKDLAINPPPRSSTPISYMPERIEEIERSSDNLVLVPPRIQDAGLDNTNYFETYQDYQYKPRIIRGRDPIMGRDSNFIENTVKSLQTIPSLTQRDRDIILGTAFGIARGISGLSSREIPNPGMHVESRSVTVDPFKYDLRLDNFDYCITGNTREQILGSRFAQTQFANPGSRFAVMQAIFQRVVDDPFSSPQAVHIALRELGQVDYPKIYQQNTMHAANKAVQSLIHPSAGDSDLIPCPVLGFEPLTDKIFKSVVLTMPHKEKYSLENEGVRPLRQYLRSLETTITYHRLSSEAAYALLLAFVEGYAHSFAYNAREKGLSFCKLWESIQKANTSYTLVDVEEEVRAVIVKRPRNVGVALHQIASLRSRENNRRFSPHLREEIIEQKTLSDFRELIHRHFPSAASAIEMAFTAQMSVEKMEAEAASRIGDLLHTKKPGTIIYIEAVNNFMAHMPMVQSGMPGNHFQNQNPNIFRQPQRAKMNAVGVEGNVGKNLLFPPQGSPQVRGARSLKSGNRSGFKQNEVRALEYGQNNVDMNQRQISLPACFLCGRTGHYYSVCNTYPNMQPRGERCQQCNGQHLPASCYRNRPRYSNPRYDRSGDGNAFNRGNVSDGRYFNNNNQGYSRNFNRPSGNYRREENRPPYYPRDQPSPYSADQQEGLNANNEVATQLVQEISKASNQGIPVQELPQ